jgi:hypothetical protein
MEIRPEAYSRCAFATLTVALTAIEPPAVTSFGCSMAIRYKTRTGAKSSAKSPTGGAHRGLGDGRANALAHCGVDHRLLGYERREASQYRLETHYLNCPEDSEICGRTGVAILLC